MRCAMSASGTSDGRVRCAWAGSDPAMIEYHDREWGGDERVYHCAGHFWQSLHGLNK